MTNRLVFQAELLDEWLQVINKDEALKTVLVSMKDKKIADLLKILKEKVNFYEIKNTKKREWEICFLLFELVLIAQKS